MNLRNLIILAGAGLLAGSCTSTTAQEARTPKAEGRLAEAIEGRVASAPVDCMPNYRSATQMEIIDDNTLVFHDGTTVYVQNPPGGCRGLGLGGYTLVTRQFGASQMTTVPAGIARPVPVISRSIVRLSPFATRRLAATPLVPTSPTNATEFVAA